MSELRILIVDEGEADRMQVCRLLEGSGLPWKCEVCVDLCSAASLLKRCQFDCILLNDHLPDGDGVTFLEKMQSEGAPLPPVILLTEVDEEEIGLRAVNAGAQDYLVKARVDSESLARAIRHAIERHRIRRELDEARARLERLVVEDSLTGLLNRRGMEKALAVEASRARRSAMPLVALLGDCDNLKEINDSLGYSAGDEVLKSVAIIMQKAVRKGDYVGRVGGDEFMILLPETHLAEGLKLAERVRLAVESSVAAFQPDPLRVTVSVGVGLIPPNSLSVTEILMRTEEALRLCKREGKNRVGIGRSNGGNSTTRRVLKSQVLQRTLLDGSCLGAACQRIFRLDGEVPVCCEVLIRGPAEMKNPEDLFAFCMHHGILISVDIQCLKRCAAAAATLGMPGRTHVNLFPSTLLDTSAAKLMEILDAHVDRNRICIEISEQQMIGDPNELAQVVAGLKAGGVWIGMDDVGFGRSSLESLLILKPDVVKIDKRLIIGIAQDEGQARTLQRLLDVIASLGAEAYAEGIESRTDLEALKKMGVKYGQGFLWERPQPVVFPQAVNRGF